MKTIKLNLRAFFVDFLNLSSTRIKLIWATFAIWVMVMFWYVAIDPIVREFFKICYATNVNLLSEHATTILGMTGTAFGLTVGSYVASKWSQYKLPDGTVVEEIDNGQKEEPQTLSQKEA